jgi:concentrative nucleoside transporter, CNT family
MRLRHVILGVLLCLSSFPAFLRAFSPDTLVYDWNLESLRSPGGETLATPGPKDYFRFQSDGSFALLVSRDSLQEAGRWTLDGDSVRLQYELLPLNTPVDSVAYSVQDGQARLRYYWQGEEIASQTDAGLNSRRRSDSYVLSFDARGNPTLSGTSRVFKLYGRAKLLPETFTFVDVLRGLLGIFSLLAICWVFSANRRAIDWKLVGSGMGLQLIFGLLVLKVPLVRTVFSWFADGFVTLLDFSKAGAAFLFDGLVTDPDSFGYIFAFQILPTIVFFSALMAVFYYLGILQKIVYAFAWLMSRTMRLSGAESLSAAGNIFLGQTESPLLIRPYLERMTRSEIMTLMTGGMATIAGGVFAAYIGYLGGTDPEATRLFATHLLTASIMSAPAAIVAAKMLVPETETVNEDLSVPRDRIGANLLDAISKGTTDGLKLAVNVGVMLLVFIALIDMLNYVFADKLGEWLDLNTWVAAQTDGRYTQFNLQYIFGLIFSPIAWLLGVPAEDMLVVGQLLGEKTIINEFVAYASLGTAKDAGALVHYKSVLIATYALCGFANFGSIGIQIGGIGALAPNQRKTLSELGLRALLGGTIAAFLTATIAGMLATV